MADSKNYSENSHMHYFHFNCDCSGQFDHRQLAVKLRFRCHYCCRACASVYCICSSLLYYTARQHIVHKIAQKSGNVSIFCANSSTPVFHLARKLSTTKAQVNERCMQGKLSICIRIRILQAPQFHFEFAENLINNCFRPIRQQQTEIDHA